MTFGVLEDIEMEHGNGSKHHVNQILKSQLAFFNIKPFLSERTWLLLEAELLKMVQVFKCKYTILNVDNGKNFCQSKDIDTLFGHQKIIKLMCMEVLKINHLRFLLTHSFNLIRLLMFNRTKV